MTSGIESAQNPPLIALSTGTMDWNRTGTWRTLKPIFQTFTPSCELGCPTGGEMREIAGLLASEHLREAWEILMVNNPLPAVCGRVCNHPCEEACTRKELEEPVSLRGIERYLGDQALKNNWQLLRPTRLWPEHVAIIGSGPAGLACAFHLCRLGYGVTIFEARKAPGGLLHYGIPEYRLPRDILAGEISHILSLGIELQLQKSLGRDLRMQDLQGFGAIFLATGLNRSRRLHIPGESLPGILSGLEFLDSVNSNHRPHPGKHVVVIGGGNTAIDAARSALRLGARTQVVYRRTRKEMPAIREEVDAAKSEGVEFTFLTAPVAIEQAEATEDGRPLLRLHCRRTRFGTAEAGSRPQVFSIPCSDFFIDGITSIIAAVGEEPNLEDLDLRRLRGNVGKLMLSADQESMIPNLFVGGDLASGAETVVSALASGKQVAWAIHRRLRDQNEKIRTETPWSGKINSFYFPTVPRSINVSLSLRQRESSFAEVDQGFSHESAVQESRRCLSCGLCTRCEICWVFCPDRAVEKEKDVYRIDYEHCKGCGICAVECPRGVITLVEEHVSVSRES
ncbi:MAG TPA: FAD-dependent oxidoreductase [bacterium]|nr:FAD-dependent oxidoreductase [bacterium]